ncbi:hypothetical protein [Mucilaginibacter sp.]|jgi:hypothetical protein|uniref:hypothetical protein n=1 Tax=Mucilaginibacter sp. TaxID=1882438 RepID=UPI0026013F62|nr:hypothetical protein [Mucilaginibacter sp.]
MKKSFLIIMAFALIFAGCKKGLSANAPANFDANYDTHNSIFRVKASSTAPFTLQIVEYDKDGTTPYNTQNADQTGPFDYGFTPVVGHRISVTIQSPKGLISSNVMYKGVYLDAVVIKKTDSGSTGSFSYTVPN